MQISLHIAPGIKRAGLTMEEPWKQEYNDHLRVM